MIVLAPKGTSDRVAQKLEKAFKEASETQAFQKVLKDLDCPYVFSARLELEKSLAEEEKAYRGALQEMGVKKGEK